MKKILLSAAVMGFLASCSSSSSSDCFECTTTTSGTTTTTKYCKVGSDSFSMTTGSVVLKGKLSASWDTYRAGIEAAAKTQSGSCK